jgi:hypothetical protein
VDATKPGALTTSDVVPAVRPENENAPDASVVVVNGASATNVVTDADTIGFDVPAWSARPANVPAAGAAGVVGVVVGAVGSELQAVVEATVRINPARIV